MAFGEVGDLLEQKVDGNLEPRSSGRAQKSDGQLAYQVLNGHDPLGRLSDGPAAYNSTPETRPS